MGPTSDRAIPAERLRAAESLAADLRRVFGSRLQSVVGYGLEDLRQPGSPLHTMALVERVTFDDLASCVPLTRAWQRLGLAVPLILSRDEFARSLDAFPLEYGAIVARHAIIDGIDPFDGLQISETDLRRACERQAKSHVIHLREGFLETGAEPRAVSGLIAASVPAFELLLQNVARLQDRTDAPIGPKPTTGHDDDLAAVAARAIGLPTGLLDEVRASRTGSTIVDPTALLSRYIAAAERTWHYIDAWRV